MNNRYIVFDVETPNHQNDRMSAIGVTVVENGKIAESKYTLVNPETYFDGFNISLTGITPEMVESAPSFYELWTELETLFESGILVAHNAPFDMSVLAKCHSAYATTHKRYAKYACTCRMGRVLLPEFPNHKLNTMCDIMGIELDHHNAGSDSTACATLLMKYIESGHNLAGFIRTYDLELQRTI